MEYTLLLLPVVMLIAGIMLYKYPPKKINFFIGYRSCKSMKNEKSWEIANKYSGEICINLGLVLLVVFGILTAILHFDILIFSETVLGIIVCTQCLFFLIPMYLVEKKLKNEKNAEQKTKISDDK